jgi:hypothetical protein
MQSQKIESEFSPEQLAGVGAVLIAYSRAEHAVDLLLSLGLGLTVELAWIVPSRIARLEDKIEIVKRAAKMLGFPQEALRYLSGSLAEEMGLLDLKRYRDAVALAGEPSKEYGKKRMILLLKPVSLKTCVQHLELISEELRYLFDIFDLARRSTKRSEKKALTTAIRDELTKLDQCRNYRLVGLRSLPKLSRKQDRR